MKLIKVGSNWFVHSVLEISKNVAFIDELFKIIHMFTISH